ncbi:MAG: VOC family protein [Magnetospirillum sp.]|nr:VOC family protein [Magnetospirillum sp.]
MHNHVIGLDHVVIAVRDLAEAARSFRRLGFTTTPRGHHPEWGTVNHCLMFEHDYIELLAAENAGAHADRVRAFTAVREGAMELSFASDDTAAAAEGLRRLGVEVGTPRALSRRLDTPEQTTLAFTELPLPPGTTPGVDSRLVQHITQERLRFPEWLDHPNGARGIISATAIVEDPTGAIPAWDRVFGPHSATPTDNTVTVHTGDGLVFLCRPDELTQLHPEAELDIAPQPPAIVAVAVRVADTARAAKVLSAGGVDFTRDTEGTLRIPPSEACGVYLELMGG